MNAKAKKLDERRRQAAAVWQELQQSPRPVIYIGTASCGLAAGAGETGEAVHKYLERSGIDGRVVPVGCIGPCYLEPLVDIQMPGRPRISYANVSAKDVPALLEAFFEKGEVPANHLAGHFGDGDHRRPTAVLRSCPCSSRRCGSSFATAGIIDPENLDHYLARDGYLGLEKCLSMPWQEVLETVKSSGLRGRGGAGFPTWRKWLTCRETESSERYLICNADEGDPGAFMNRSLIEGDPHAVLEGMLIAAYAIGASQGYIYIRAEYPLAIERLQNGDRRHARGSVCWARISWGAVSTSTSRSRRAPAPLSAARRPPSSPPSRASAACPAPGRPFPAVSGVYGKPTIINNVETLGTLPNILRNGADWYCRRGHGDEPRAPRPSRWSARSGARV